MTHPQIKESIRTTWLVVLLLLLWIVAKWMFSFTVVGDLGQPGWDYRPVADVPSESAYAVYELVPYPQHVKGAKGE